MPSQGRFRNLSSVPVIGQHLLENKRQGSL